MTFALKLLLIFCMFLILSAAVVPKFAWGTSTPAALSSLASFFYRYMKLSAEAVAVFASFLRPTSDCPPISSRCLRPSPASSQWHICDCCSASWAGFFSDVAFSVVSDVIRFLIVCYLLLNKLFKCCDYYALCSECILLLFIIIILVHFWSILKHSIQIQYIDVYF